MSDRRQEIKKALARKDFKEFVAYTKKDYDFNWHHELVCKKLQAVYEGKIKRLILTAPPRHGKTELASRRFPAFCLGGNPDIKLISTSYSAELASSFNRDVQRIIDDQKYLELFPNTRLNGTNVRTTKNWLRNNDIFEIVDHQGVYKSSGVGGAITGLGGDILLIDDPFKNQEEASSATIRKKVFEWYTSTLYTRQEKDAAIVLIQTRWHEEDLAGMLIELSKHGEEFSDQWEVVNIPAIKKGEPSQEDPREDGEALWPRKYNLGALAKIRTTLGSSQFSSLYQQNPTPEDGRFVKLTWLKTYEALPDHFENTCISIDMNFGSSKDDSSKIDYVVCSAYGKLGGSFYLIDQIRDQWDFPEAIAQIERFIQKYPKITARLVEVKANGQAVIDTLKSKIYGLIPVIPNASKQSRMTSIQPLYEARNIYYPNSKDKPFIQNHIDEIVGFPNMKHDDCVDAETQAISYLKEDKIDFPEEFAKFEGSGFDNGKISW